MSRARSILGIAHAEIYSVCKLIDTTQGVPEYLSAASLIYAHASRRVTMVDVLVRNFEFKQIVQRFCGRGPEGFEDILATSGKYLDESRTSRQLLCREGFKALDDVVHFITGHLQAEAQLDQNEVVAATDEVLEIVETCFRGRS
jgi:hypothetical protein